MSGDGAWQSERRQHTLPLRGRLTRRTIYCRSWDAELRRGEPFREGLCQTSSFASSVHLARLPQVDTRWLPRRQKVHDPNKHLLVLIAARPSSTTRATYRADCVSEPLRRPGGDDRSHSAPRACSRVGRSRRFTTRASNVGSGGKVEEEGERGKTRRLRGNVTKKRRLHDQVARRVRARIW